MFVRPDIRDTFDRLATEYDELKVRIIPGYRDVHDLALRYAGANRRTCKRILELGCGTGEWAAAFLRDHPESDYLAIDFSARMRDLASTRLAAYGARARLVDRDLNAPLPEGPFDLAVSFFAIHHVENKARLVRDVFERLAPGALFLYADITVAPDPGLEQSFLDGWVAFMRRAGLEQERIPYVLADHRDNDMPESASAQISYLRAAGFSPAEAIWSWEKFALFYAAKPISSTEPAFPAGHAGATPDRPRLHALVPRTSKSVAGARAGQGVR
jgi:SAM-dependent methyltransferase